MPDVSAPVDAARHALEEFDHSQAPASLVARIAVESAEPAWRAEVERTLVAPLRAEVQRLTAVLRAQHR